MAAEYATLPKPMKEEMKHFFDENERWLTAVLKQGQKARELKFSDRRMKSPAHWSARLKAR